MSDERSTATQVIPVDFIERKIYLIRGQKVMLDSDLAELYQVATRVLNQAVRRNLDRFLADFMFQLNEEERENWRSQIVTSTHEELARKLDEVERTQEEHSEHLRQIYAYIDRLLEPTPEPRKRRIGFCDG